MTTDIWSLVNNSSTKECGDLDLSKQESADSPLFDPTDKPMSFINQKTISEAPPAEKNNNGFTFRDNLIFNGLSEPFSSRDEAFVAKEHISKKFGSAFTIIRFGNGFALAEEFNSSNPGVDDAARAPDMSEAWSKPSSITNPELTASGDFGVSESDEIAHDKRLQKEKIILRPSYRSQFNGIMLGGTLMFCGLIPDRILLSIFSRSEAMQIAEIINWQTLCLGLSYAFYAFGGFLLGKALLVRLLSRYEISRNFITTRTWSLKNGKIHYSQTKTMYENIVTTELDQGIVGRILNYGDLSIETASDTDPCLAGIARPSVIQQAVEERKINRQVAMRLNEDHIINKARNTKAR